MSAPRYSLGLDFGTTSARALLVDVDTGLEVGAGVAPFAHGEAGIIADDRNPHLARQLPVDWQSATETAVAAALEATDESGARVDGRKVVGIGIDATASTPLPVDTRCRALADNPAFRERPDAMAWLWKDHTAHAEAEEITELASRELPEHLARCGGSYSSEWFFAKLLRCLRVAPDVLDAAADWVECGEWITAFLTGNEDPRSLPRGVCAAGHKGFYHDRHGLPPRSFLEQLDPRLGAWCEGRLFERAVPAGHAAGVLCEEWARRLGLRVGTPVSVAAIDAHVGAVGAGVRPGRLVKIVGTSACDMTVHPLDATPLGEIDGLSGVVQGSILPGHWGIEAGQSAVGDIFGWFVRQFAKPAGLDHDELTRRCAARRPGESGLLALDWNNGNRSILQDPLLTGCLVGQTLRTTPDEVYRALLESTAFGARIILERIEASGVAVDEVVLCGGIARKNPLLLDIYADVWKRPLKLSRSPQTCALGAAVFGAVACGAHDSVRAAQDAMSGMEETECRPDAHRARVYDELFGLYRKLHDAFGGVRQEADVSGVMKALLEVQGRARG